MSCTKFFNYTKSAKLVRMQQFSTFEYFKRLPSKYDLTIILLCQKLCQKVSQSWAGYELHFCPLHSSRMIPAADWSPEPDFLVMNYTYSDFSETSVSSLKYSSSHRSKSPRLFSLTNERTWLYTTSTP